MGSAEGTPGVSRSLQSRQRGKKPPKHDITEATGRKEEEGVHRAWALLTWGEVRKGHRIQWPRQPWGSGGMRRVNGPRRGCGWWRGGPLRDTGSWAPSH